MHFLFLFTLLGLGVAARQDSSYHVVHEKRTVTGGTLWKRVPQPVQVDTIIPLHIALTQQNQQLAGLICSQSRTRPRPLLVDTGIRPRSLPGLPRRLTPSRPCPNGCEMLGLTRSESSLLTAAGGCWSTTQLWKRHNGFSRQHTIFTVVMAMMMIFTLVVRNTRCLYLFVTTWILSCPLYTWVRLILDDDDDDIKLFVIVQSPLLILHSELFQVQAILENPFLPNEPPTTSRASIV